MSQLNAILRSIGTEYRCYAEYKDWKKAALIDMIVETYSECFEAYCKIAKKSTEEDRLAEFQVFKDGILTQFLNMCEKELQNNSFCSYIVGEYITIADFSLISFIMNVLRNDSEPFHDQFEKKLDRFSFFLAYEKRVKRVIML